MSNHTRPNKVNAVAGLRRGAAVLETAILLPLLLMLAMGAVEFGWQFHVRHRMIDTARYVCRYAVRGGDADVQGQTLKATTLAQQQLADLSGQFVITVDKQAASRDVTVTISIQRSAVSIVRFITTGTITTQITMRKEDA